MLFNSLDFLLFFPAVCLIAYALRSLRARNLFLLAASYWFYMNWRAEYALLILWGTALTWVLANMFERTAARPRLKKALLVTGLAGVLAPLFVFKYLNFAAASIETLLRASGLKMEIPAFELILPVGISFFSFQMIGYLVDVYKGNLQPEKSFCRYALFVSFFPQLVAGPIERAKNLLPQFASLRKFDPALATDGVRMMLWGYFMKLCVAERVAPYVNATFNNWERHNGTSLLLATFFFAFQIYCDFCGYSLIARGAAAVLGFRLMDNFRRPYLASSLKEFWRRWHISLSTWFMDYVYIPLGGNRCSALRHAYNLFVTFLLSGIWHGANWTFVIWGAIHGTFLAAAALLRRGTCAAAKTGPGFVTRLIGWPVTFAVVLFAWIFFRANNVTAAFGIIGKIFTQPGPLFPGDGVPNQALGIFCIGILMMRELKEEFFPRFRLLTSDRFFVSAFSAAALAMFIMLTAVWHGGEFIYFPF